MSTTITANTNDITMFLEEIIKIRNKKISQTPENKREEIKKYFSDEKLKNLIEKYNITSQVFILRAKRWQNPTTSDVKTLING